MAFKFLLTKRKRLLIDKYQFIYNKISIKRKKKKSNQIIKKKKAYCGCFFFAPADLEGWSVFVLILPPPVPPPPIPPPDPPPVPDEPDDGLFGGMFILRTDSRMIWRIVFKKAFRNSDVLQRIQNTVKRSFKIHKILQLIAVKNFILNENVSSQIFLKQKKKK